MPGRMAGAAAEVSTAADLGDSTAADSGDSTAVDLADFTVALPVCTVVSASGTRVSASGARVSVSGARVSAADFSYIPGGVIIQTTAIMTIANPTPPRPGITAPIRQAITLM